MIQPNGFGKLSIQPLKHKFKNGQENIPELSQVLYIIKKHKLLVFNIFIMFQLILVLLVIGLELLIRQSPKLVILQIPLVLSVHQFIELFTNLQCQKQLLAGEGQKLQLSLQLLNSLHRMVSQLRNLKQLSLFLVLMLSIHGQLLVFTDLVLHHLLIHLTLSPQLTIKQQQLVLQ